MYRPNWLHHNFSSGISFQMHCWIVCLEPPMEVWTHVIRAKRLCGGVNALAKRLCVVTLAMQYSVTITQCHLRPYGATDCRLSTQNLCIPPLIFWLNSLLHRTYQLQIKSTYYKVNLFEILSTCWRDSMSSV